MVGTFCIFFHVVSPGLPGLESAERLLDESTKLQSKPEADRDSGHSEGTTLTTVGEQQSRASATGGEGSLSTEEPDAEEGQGQLPQDLPWDKVAAAEARKDDPTGMLHVLKPGLVSNFLCPCCMSCQISSSCKQACK